MGAWDYFKKAAGAVLPGVALAPLNMAEKAWAKYQKNDKATNNRNRLISGAILGVSLAIITVLPQVSPTLVALVSDNISNTLGAQLAIFCGAGYAGFGLGMLGCKLVSKLINKCKYGVTNSDHIPLTNDNIEKLRNAAHWIPLDKKDEVKKLHAFLIEKAVILPEDGRQLLSCDTKTIADRERAKQAYKKLLLAINTGNATYLTDVVTYLTTEITNTNPQMREYQREARGIKLITPPGTPPPESPPPESPPPLSRAHTPPPRMPSSHHSANGKALAAMPSPQSAEVKSSERVTVDMSLIDKSGSAESTTKQLMALRNNSFGALYQRGDLWDEDGAPEEKKSPAKSEKSTSHEQNLKTLQDYQKKISDFREVISAHYLLSPKAKPQKLKSKKSTRRRGVSPSAAQSVDAESSPSPAQSAGTTGPTSVA